MFVVTGFVVEAMVHFFFRLEGRGVDMVLRTSEGWVSLQSKCRGGNEEGGGTEHLNGKCARNY